MPFGQIIRSILFGTLLVPLACHDYRSGMNDSPKTGQENGKDPGSAASGDGRADGSEDESKIASEPVAIGGAYLIEPGQVHPTVIGNSADMQGAPGSVKPQGSQENMERSIELVAFDMATYGIQTTATGFELNVRVLAKSGIAADGSFRVQGELKLGELLFLRAPARGATPVVIDSTKVDMGLVWLDPTGLILRHIDEQLAQTIKTLVTPSAAFQLATTRLGTTGQCRGCYLAGIDLSNSNIAGADLTDAVLTGAKFNQANVQYVKFIRADLRQAEFRNAALDFADFTGARLEGIITQGAAVSTAVNL